MELKDTPKRLIFPTILRRIRFFKSENGTNRIPRNVLSFLQYYAACFIKSEDVTERYPETSYLSHNSKQRLFRQA